MAGSSFTPFDHLDTDVRIAHPYVEPFVLADERNVRFLSAVFRRPRFQYGRRAWRGLSVVAWLGDRCSRAGPVSRLMRYCLPMTTERGAELFPATEIAAADPAGIWWSGTRGRSSS